jgi:hypothetical protein
LSFTRGRLSERTTPIIEYDDFAKWLDDMAAQVRDNALSGDDSLERFARPYQYTGGEEPRHILFDIASEAIDATAMPPLTPAPNADDLWVVNGGTFTERSRSSILKQRFSSTRKPAVLRLSQHNSTPSGSMFRMAEEGSSRIILMNRRSSVLGTAVVYAQGRFFTPNLRPWRGGGSRINIEKIVVGCARPCRHHL